MKGFDKAFDLVIGHEGGFTNRSTDPGNWTGGRVGSGILRGTKYGISAGAFPKLDIKNMTLEQAKDIYLEHYWHPSGAAACPSGVDYMVFDSAVNNGVGSAARFLQRAVGAQDDGKVGPKTLAAVAKAAIADPDGLLEEFQAQRIWHHMKIKSMVDEFGLGWSRRLVRVLLTAKKMMDT